MPLTLLAGEMMILVLYRVTIFSILHLSDVTDEAYNKLLSPSMFPKKGNMTGSSVSYICSVQYFEFVFITSNSLLESSITKKKSFLTFLVMASELWRCEGWMECDTNYLIQL